MPGDGGSGEGVVGSGRCDPQHFTPLKRVGEVRAAVPLLHAEHIDYPLVYPCCPLAPSLPVRSSAPAARPLQALLAIHGDRNYSESSEEESWQAEAGQGSWWCVTGPE